MATTPHTVCVIDDDPAVLKVTCSVLDGNGYRCRCFNDANSFLHDYSPTDDCVVTDLKMPGMEGADLVERLRDIDPTLPVIVLSGYADVPTAVKLMEGGVATIMEKPISSIDLLAAVARAVDKGAERRLRRDQAHDMRQRMSGLSEEELAVMQGVVQGTANKVLASRLNMSARTLDRRRHSVFEKMGVATAAELAAVSERYALFGRR